MMPYDDAFHCNKNRIPFCFSDAMVLTKAAIKEKDLIVGRSFFQAISDYAQMFMSQTISRAEVSSNENLGPKVLLNNVRGKYPSLANDAAKLYEKHMAKWENEHQIRRSPRESVKRQEDPKAPKPNPVSTQNISKKYEDFVARLNKKYQRTQWEEEAKEIDQDISSISSFHSSAISEEEDYYDPNQIGEIQESEEFRVKSSSMEKEERGEEDEVEGEKRQLNVSREPHPAEIAMENMEKKSKDPKTAEELMKAKLTRPRPNKTPKEFLDAILDEDKNKEDPGTSNKPSMTIPGPILRSQITRKDTLRAKCNEPQKKIKRQAQK